MSGATAPFRLVPTGAAPVGIAQSGGEAGVSDHSDPSDRESPTLAGNNEPVRNTLRDWLTRLPPGLPEVMAARAAWLAKAAADAFEALQAPEVPPPPSETNHDGPEREAMRACYNNWTYRMTAVGGWG